MNAKERIPLVIPLLLAVVFIGGLFLDYHPARDRPMGCGRTEFAGVLSDVSADSILATVNMLAGLRTRRFNSPGAAAAAMFITRKLRGLGLPVEHQRVNVTDERGNPVAVTNVSAELGPSRNGTFIICAHYDSKVEEPNGVAPGADDNASGVAVLLETARVLRAAGIAPGVTLVFFGGEEDDLLGSRAFAESVAAEHVPLRGVINVDMVGYDEQGLDDIVLFTNRASVPLAEELRRAVRPFSDLGVDTTITSKGNSDHVPFWESGRPAVSVWEGYDHNSVHDTPADTPAKLSRGFVAKVTRLIIAAAVCLAPPERPSHARLRTHTETPSIPGTAAPR